MEEIEYNASTTASRFHSSDKFVRALMGPLGSGKTVACIMELLKRAVEQKPDKRGVRKSRWAVIRNTYRELIDTTLKIFFEWVPEHQGKFHTMNMAFTLSTRLDDGTTVQAEFLFRALDRPVDIKKLLSLNLTGGFINEAREVPLVVLEALGGRCGRFPSMKDGGPSWHGVIADTNPPDSDHWWYKLFEELSPANHELFKQPSGVGAKAENTANLPLGYYENLMQGKDQEWINVYVKGEYGFVSDGRPVFGEYNDSLHYNEALQLRRSSGLSIVGSTDIGPPLYKLNSRMTGVVGIDFGLTPAAAVGVRNSSGQLLLLDELCTFDMGAMNFGRLLRQKLSTPPWNIITQWEIYADPAGEQRAQTDERTPFMVLQQQGIEAWPAPTNDFTIRREVVGDLLTRLVGNGLPALQIGPGAPLTRRALGGGYKYKRLQLSGEERYVDKPDKNKFSHIADAVQYLVLGAMGDSHVIGGFSKKTPDYTLHNRGIV